MADKSNIKEHMVIVGADGRNFDVVDRVEGEAIKVTKGASGEHHYIPLSWVEKVDDKVHLNVSAEQATREWTTSPPTSA